MPNIAIGIPTLNGPDRLERCLRSIKKYTPKRFDFQVTVSDDFSTEKNITYNKVICNTYGVPLLLADNRYGVSEQWNRLVRHNPSQLQILMNDDVEVVEHWLDALAYSIVENPHAGVIGLKAHQGVNSISWTPPPPISYAEAVMERGRGFLSSQGFLFGFMKDKWDAVGGFDTQFFAFYEEVDFGIRLFQQNWPSYMLSYPIVLHQGGATTSDQSNIDARRVLAESREKFKRKHQAIWELRNQMDEMELHHSWPPLRQWNTGLSSLND